MAEIKTRIFRVGSFWVVLASSSCSWGWLELQSFCPTFLMASHCRSTHMWHNDMHQDGPLRLKYGMRIVCDAASVATITDGAYYNGLELGLSFSKCRTGILSGRTGEGPVFVIIRT